MRQQRLNERMKLILSKHKQITNSSLFKSKHEESKTNIITQYDSFRDPSTGSFISTYALCSDNHDNNHRLNIRIPR